MLLFRSEEHIDVWCASRNLARGATMTPAQGWRLARGWYGDKLNPEWRRHSPGETEQLLADVGLKGPFWSLRG